MSKPHATWEPELNEEERKSTWAEAAGWGKSPTQHASARKIFIRNANEDAALAKNGVGLTADDNTVLKKRQDRLSNQKAANGVFRGKPGNREKNNAAVTAYYKAKADALRVERKLDSEAKGVGVTTEFGLGDVPRSDELNERVHDIMHSSAGVFQFKFDEGILKGEFEGETTFDNWVRDHGEFMSVKEVLETGKWAVYILTTRQKITPGTEIKCRETTEFMVDCVREPLWRIDTRPRPHFFGRPGIFGRPKHVDKEGDLRLFMREEAKTVALTYILAKCVSGYDATSVEGSLQRYLENEMRMPHGLYLHQKAGAGPLNEYGSTNPETTWVGLTLIRVTSPTFADVDPVDPNRSPALTSCTVTSHDGKTDYKVAARGHKEKFPDTKSVLADEATNAAERLQRSTRHKKRKADKISRADEDGILSV